MLEVLVFGRFMICLWGIGVGLLNWDNEVIICFVVLVLSIYLFIKEDDGKKE